LVIFVVLKFFPSLEWQKTW